MAMILAAEFPAGAAELDGITPAKDESGRTVYVNAEKGPTVKQRPRRASVLITA